MSHIRKSKVVRDWAKKRLPFEPAINMKKVVERWDADLAEALKNGKRYKDAKSLFRDLDRQERAVAPKKQKRPL
jgi:hypothetical protein